MSAMEAADEQGGGGESRARPLRVRLQFSEGLGGHRLCILVPPPLQLVADLADYISITCLGGGCGGKRKRGEAMPLTLELDSGFQLLPTESLQVIRDSEVLSVRPAEAARPKKRSKAGIQASSAPTEAVHDASPGGTSVRKSENQAVDAAVRKKVAERKGRDKGGAGAQGDDLTPSGRVKGVSQVAPASRRNVRPPAPPSLSSSSSPSDDDDNAGRAPEVNRADAKKRRRDRLPRASVASTNSEFTATHVSKQSMPPSTKEAIRAQEAAAASSASSSSDQGDSSSSESEGRAGASKKPGGQTPSGERIKKAVPHTSGVAASQKDGGLHMRFDDAQVGEGGAEGDDGEAETEEFKVHKPAAVPVVNVMNPKVKALAKQAERMAVWGNKGRRERGSGRGRGDRMWNSYNGGERPRGGLNGYTPRYGHYGPQAGYGDHAEEVAEKQEDRGEQEERNHPAHRATQRVALFVPRCLRVTTTGGQSRAGVETASGTAAGHGRSGLKGAADQVDEKQGSHHVPAAHASGEPVVSGDSRDASGLRAYTAEGETQMPTGGGGRTGAVESDSSSSSEEEEEEEQKSEQGERVGARSTVQNGGRGQVSSGGSGSSSSSSEDEEAEEAEDTDGDGAALEGLAGDSDEDEHEDRHDTEHKPPPMRYKKPYVVVAAVGLPSEDRNGIAVKEVAREHPAFPASAKPQVGDVIDYRTLELSEETWTPMLSARKTGVVKGFVDGLVELTSVEGEAGEIEQLSWESLRGVHVMSGPTFDQLEEARANGADQSSMEVVSGGVGGEGLDVLSEMLRRKRRELLKGLEPDVSVEAAGRNGTCESEMNGKSLRGRKAKQ